MTKDMSIIIPFEGAGNFYIYLPASIPDSYPAWNSATNYFAALKTRVTRSLQDFECLVDNTNVDPLINTGNVWGLVGLTGTLKLLDEKVGVKHPGGLLAEIAPIDPKVFITAGAVFGLEATAVRLKVTDPTVGIVYDVTKSLINTRGILDYDQYFFSTTVLDDSCVFLNLPPYLNARYYFEATENNGASPGLGGEVVLGYNYVIGEVTEGTSIDLIDYSTIETDVFGTTAIVRRASVQTATYNYIMEVGTEKTVQGLLQRCLGRPVVYHTGEDSNVRGTLVYGVLNATPIPLGLPDSVSVGTIEVKGLT